MVRAEDSNEVLLESRVLLEDGYQRQQGSLQNHVFPSLGPTLPTQIASLFSPCEDTLIVWTEPDRTDLALSFQEAAGCSDVW